MFSFQSFPPFFPTLRHSNLGLTAHPLADYLGPNPNGHCSPLAFDTLLFFHLLDSVLRLFALLRFRFKAFLHFFQPFDTPTSVSLLIHLQTILVRTPTAIALRWPSTPYFFSICLTLCYGFLLFFVFVSKLSSIFSNPSTLQPRSHCSSPCRLSWSEPQRPLLSVGLRRLTFFPSA